MFFRLSLFHPLKGHISVVTAMAPAQLRTCGAELPSTGLSLRFKVLSFQMWNLQVHSAEGLASISL